MDMEGLAEAYLLLERRVATLEAKVNPPKKKVAEDKPIDSPLDLKAGFYYRLKYRLRGQKAQRYARLQFLGFSESGMKSAWSGRPTIGTLTLHRDEVLECIEPATQESKSTYFDARCYH